MARATKPRPNTEKPRACRYVNHERLSPEFLSKQGACTNRLMQWARDCLPRRLAESTAGHSSGRCLRLCIESRRLRPQAPTELQSLRREPEASKALAPTGQLNCRTLLRRLPPPLPLPLPLRLLQWLRRRRRRQRLLLLLRR